MPEAVKKREIDITKLAFNIPEACIILNISRPTITKMINQGNLKSVKAGEKRYLIPNWAIHEFLNSPQGEK